MNCTNICYDKVSKLIFLEAGDMLSFFIDPFNNGGTIVSQSDNDENNNSSDHNSEPSKVVLLFSVSVNPANIPEVVASNRQEASSNSGQQTEVGHSEEVRCVSLTDNTAASRVDAGFIDFSFLKVSLGVGELTSGTLQSSFSILTIFPSFTEPGVVAFSTDILVGASSTFEFILVDELESVSTVGSSVIVVNVSSMTICETSEVDQGDDGDQQQDGHGEESNSIVSVVNDESNEGQDGDENTSPEKSGGDPAGEMSLDGREVDVVIVQVSEPDKGQTEDQQKEGTKEVKIGHGGASWGQVLESSSGDQEEIEELSNEEDLEEEI